MFPNTVVVHGRKPYVCSHSSAAAVAGEEELRRMAAEDRGDARTEEDGVAGMPSEMRRP